jgi:hypothetical protein
LCSILQGLREHHHTSLLKSSTKQVPVSGKGLREHNYTALHKNVGKNQRHSAISTENVQ